MRPAPAAAEAALRVLSIGELDASTLALVIGSDPALTAAIIRASEPADRGISIASRITMLTPARLNSALFPALTDGLTSACDFSEDDANAWRTALATAIAAETIASERGDVSPDTAYLAGLLHRQGASGNMGAVARRYRFPRWLTSCLDPLDTEQAFESPTGVDPLRITLRLAKDMGAALVAPGSSGTHADLARRMGVDADRYHRLFDRAAQSFERRMSLFAFTPAPADELRTSLLRFANQLLLLWRVDELSAGVARARINHLEALRLLLEAGVPQLPLDELLLTCADLLREALAAPGGLIVAWTDDASPITGVRWNTARGQLEPLHVEPMGTPSERSLIRLFAQDVWPDTNSGPLAPLVLPVYTPDRHHRGFLALVSPGLCEESWVVHAQEWASALGKAIHRILEAERDDAERRARWGGTREAPKDSTGPLPDRDEAIARQRNIARAAMAALHAPLAAMTTQAHQLISQSIDGETQRLVEDLAKQARNAARVMADLRMIAGNGEVPNEYILINAPLRQFLHASRPRLERRAIRLTEHLSEGIPRIRADARKLNHLFTNLFAYIEQRLGHAGRAITVWTSPSEDRASALLRIEASGLALTQEQAETLFTPFDHLERASNEHALSLAACSSIVDEIGGRIGVDVSGSGCLFQIAFDAVNAVLAAESSPTAENTPTVAASPPTVSAKPEETDERPRVLIVDDDEVMRDLMKQALLRKSYRVETAKDGVEAARVLDSMSIDLVLLDLLMPNRDGFTVLRDLKRRESAPPAIVLTGSRSPELRNDAMELGARSFLQKPFELGQLLAEVEAVLVHQVR